MSAADENESTDDRSGHNTSALGLHLGFETSPAAAEARICGEELASGSALLVVKRGRNAGARFVLNQPVTTAGRLPQSDVLLDDVTVSRRHAEFRAEHGEYRVVDTGSLNRIYVNRQPVESAILTNGDEIQIGKFRLVFLNTAPTC